MRVVLSEHSQECVSTVDQDRKAALSFPAGVLLVSATGTQSEDINVALEFIAKLAKPSCALSHIDWQELQARTSLEIRSALFPLLTSKHYGCLYAQLLDRAHTVYAQPQESPSRLAALNLVTPYYKGIRPSLILQYVQEWVVEAPIPVIYAILVPTEDWQFTADAYAALLVFLEAACCTTASHLSILVQRVKIYSDKSYSAAAKTKEHYNYTFRIVADTSSLAAKIRDILHPRGAHESISIFQLGPHVLICAERIDDGLSFACYKKTSLLVPRHILLPVPGQVDAQLRLELAMQNLQFVEMDGNGTPTFGILSYILQKKVVLRPQQLADGLQLVRVNNNRAALITHLLTIDGEAFLYRNLQGIEGYLEGTHLLSGTDVTEIVKDLLAHSCWGTDATSLVLSLLPRMSAEELQRYLVADVEELGKGMHQLHTSAATD